MLNDFRSRWNGDIWLFFSYKVMFLYRYFLSSVHMQNMYMKHSCMFFSLNDRHALLIKVCCKNKIMIIILSCNLSIHPFAVLHMVQRVAVSLKNVSCTQYCITNCISFSVRYHYHVFNFSIKIITRIGSKCYGLINLIHVLSFSDISFKYCTLYCHFSLIFVTLHVLVFLFYKKKKCYGI